MAAAVKFYCTAEDLAEKRHNFASDTLKVMLTNTAPDLTDTAFAHLSEISSGNGYTAGGTAASVVSSSQSSGVYKLVLSDVVFTASGGSIGPFRYVVLYNATADRPIQYWDYGAALTLLATETFTVDFDPTAGVLTLT